MRTARSADSISRFRERHPHLPLIVVLTGTDVYRDIHRDQKSQQSLEYASRLVVLQKRALSEIPRRLQRKTRVIYQSAESVPARLPRRNDAFDVCVIGHLRAEKDPLRTAMAVRTLPLTSRIRVTHIGQALDSLLEKRARQEVRRNPRYRWIGQLSHKKTRERLAQSRLLCITSKMEGSSNVLSEALASGVPVVAAKISGLMGTLGRDFIGFFPVGNTNSLRRLLLRAETDSKFYRRLKQRGAELARLVKPKREIDAWRKLLSDTI